MPVFSIHSLLRLLGFRSEFVAVRRLPKFALFFYGLRSIVLRRNVD
jgi:hypothetical protein